MKAAERRKAEAQGDLPTIFACEWCQDSGRVYAPRGDGPPYDIHTGERRIIRCPRCNPFRN